MHIRRGVLNPSISMLYYQLLFLIVLTNYYLILKEFLHLLVILLTCVLHICSVWAGGLWSPEDKLQGSVLFPPSVFWEENSGHEACCHTLLPTETSYL